MTPAVTLLHHLGLPDEKVWEVAWDDLDRSFDPDHLTSLWVPELEAPVGRIGALFAPIGSAASLEAAVMPSAATIAEAVRTVMT